MVYSFLQALFLLLYFLISFGRFSFSHSRLTSSLLIGFNALSILAYAILYYLTSGDVSDQAYYHIYFSKDGMAVVDFSYEIFISLSLILLTCLALYFYIRFSIINSSIKSYFSSFFLFLLFIFSPVPSQLMSDVFYSSVNINSSVNANLLTSISNKRQTNKKNLVFIYAESLEQNYFNTNTFPDLLPKLSKLSLSSTNFNSIYQLNGSGWTMGGIVSSQCSIPLFTLPQFSDNKSVPESARYLRRAYCLSDFLSDSSYDVNFIGGANLSFAGKGTFWKSHSVDSPMGKKELSNVLPDMNGYMSPWGFHDDTMLNFAAKKINNAKLSGSPFAYFVLTLGTHHPHGFIARECVGKALKYKHINNKMADAVLCADHLLSSFIEKVRDENTTVILVSDHLAMKNDLSDYLSLNNTRKNTFLVWSNDLSPSIIDKPGSHLDIFPTVLDILNLGTANTFFGTSLLSENPSLIEIHNNIDSANSFLEKHRNDVLSLW